MALIKILQTAANKSEIFSFWYFLLWIIHYYIFGKTSVVNLNDFPLIFCLSIKITNEIKLWGLTEGDSILLIVPSIQILLICWLKFDCMIVWFYLLENCYFILLVSLWCCIVRLCNIIRWPVELLLLFHRLQMERLTVQKK